MGPSSKKSNSNKKKAAGGNNKKRKLAVVFDPTERMDFLTGFSKRKQARRKFGLDMQAMKDYKAKMEERKQVRESKKSALEEALKRNKGQSNDGDDEEVEAGSGEAESEDELDSLPLEEETLEYSDVLKQSEHGDAVTVTTVMGIPDSDSESEGEAVDRLVEAKLRKLRGESGPVEGDEDEGAASRGGAAKPKKRQDIAQTGTEIFKRIQKKSKMAGLPKIKKKGHVSEQADWQPTSKKKGGKGGDAAGGGGKRGGGGGGGTFGQVREGLQETFQKESEDCKEAWW